MLTEQKRQERRRVLPRFWAVWAFGLGVCLFVFPYLSGASLVSERAKPQPPPLGESVASPQFALSGEHDPNDPCPHQRVTLAALGGDGVVSDGSSNFMAAAPCTNEPVFSTAPTTISFSAMQEVNPASQSLSITNTGGFALNWTATVSTASGGNWLSVTPSGGTTPGTPAASVNTSGLAVGTYRGTITVRVTGVVNSPQLVTVTLTVSSDTASPTAPTSLTATATSSTQVNLTWTASTDNAGVHHYEVWRSFNNGQYVRLAPDPTATTFSDSAVSGGVTYLYRVRAVDAAGNVSGDSNVDLATTVLFTDDPLVAGVTVVKAAHILELRQAVNAVRASAGQAAASWTDPSLAGLFIKTVHLQELRSNLSPALSTLGFPAPAYTDPTLIAGSTVVKKAHVEDLRQGVK